MIAVAITKVIVDAAAVVTGILLTRGGRDRTRRLRRREIAENATGRDRRSAHELAISTLVAAAVQRHGQVAVLHALARREQDAVEALSVL